SGGNIRISELDPDTLTVSNTQEIGRAKTSTGWAVVVHGKLYIANSYASSAITSRFDIATGTWDQTYTNAITSSGYTSHVSYNYASNQLFQWDRGRTRVYDNAAVGTP
ncbi:MAG: hypothetical protein OEW42_20810, partial [Acidimicrobiia bacterium]|nr:hypothetical protein [Acidimicrobiia bacterium]